MKQVTLPKPNLDPNFIGSWILDPPSVCDELINYFECNQYKQHRGVTTGGLHVDAKNSIDISISPKDLKRSGNEVFEQYFLGLFACYKDYVVQWPFLATFAKDLQIGRFTIQRYQSGQHFKNTHSERCSLDTLHRVFAWMTYLNDVELKDGGSTFFSHYGIEVQPRKGLTLIWPAEWTHAHRGNVLHAESKYIMTGHLFFPNKSD
jgi:hypothetical protein